MLAKEQLKIAMLSVHSCPVGKLGRRDTGGMNVYIRELACELGRRGHTVDIYTRAHDPMDDQIIELGEGVRLIHLDAGEVEDIHKLAVYVHLADFACKLESFRKHNDLRYDLIHSHYWLSGWVGRRIQGWWNVPHITMFHTLGAVKNAIGVGEEEPELRIQTEQELVKNCNRVITATEKERQDLNDYYNASSQIISVIPCGVNLNLFQPVDKSFARHRLGFNTNSNIVLFVGRVDPLKGIDKLFVAISYLRQRREVRLVVIGGDDYSQPEVKGLMMLSRELQIEDLVTFAGAVKQEDLPFYYSAADVCVIPSYYESFGLVALESLACETPIVSTRVGGIESIVVQGENGYIVTANTPHILADMIAVLLTKQDTGSMTTDLTRGIVARFSWSNIAEAIVEEYRAELSNYTVQIG